MDEEEMRTFMKDHLFKIKLDIVNRTMEVDLKTVNKLKPIDSADFKAKNKEEDVRIVCSGYQIRMREFLYVDIRIVKWLPAEFFPEITQPRLKYPKIQIDESLMIFSTKSLSHLYNEILQTGYATKIKGCMIESWLIHFCVYGKKFLDVYSRYCEDPDNGSCVKDVTDEQMKEYVAEYGIKMDNEISEPDRRVMCHLILVAGSKLLKTGYNELVDWVNEQKKVAFASLGRKSNYFPCDVDGLREISAALNLRPKLKQLLYSCCVALRTDYPEMDSAATLLADAVMKPAMIITMFIRAKRRSMAKLHPAVLEEVEAYLNDLDVLKSNYQENWVYHKLLVPNERTMNFAKYPNLIARANEWLDRCKKPTFSITNVQQLLVANTPAYYSVDGAADNETVVQHGEGVSDASADTV